MAPGNNAPEGSDPIGALRSAQDHIQREEARTMSKNPPPPIHIRVDTQEQRSGIPALLADMPQVHVEETQLQVGDYDIGGDPRRVIERKTATDFLISLQQGRLFEQLAAILATDFAPLLLLEGDPLRVGRSQMRPEAIRGALTYVSAILHVPILPSGGPSETALLLYSAAKQCQVGYTVPGPAVGRRAASLSEQQIHVMMSLPGIGQATARALRARFGSLHELLHADAVTLAMVPGISPAKATALVQFLHAALATSDAGTEAEV